jgi:hypothetical protein
MTVPAAAPSSVVVALPADSERPNRGSLGPLLVSFEMTGPNVNQNIDDQQPMSDYCEEQTHTLSDLWAWD